MFKNMILRPLSASSEAAPAADIGGAPNLEHIDDDYRVQDACREFDHAFAEFHGRGDQPSYQAMRALYSAGMALRDALLAAEDLTVRGERLTRLALLEAHEQLVIEMRLEPNSALTKLRHLDIASTRYLAATPGLNRFPALFTALETYVLALRSQPQMRAADNDWHIENDLHVEFRSQLDAAARATRLNKFRGAENAYWNKNSTPCKLLKIGFDYRSVSEDWAAFRDMFESGALMHTYCAIGEKSGTALFDEYAHSLTSIQQTQHLYRDIPLHDLIAVRTYSENSGELNKVLMANDKASILAYAPYIKLMVSALSQFPETGQDLALHRGVRLNASQIVSAGLFAGNRVTTRAFSSCSTTGTSAYCTMTEKYNVQITVQGGHAKLPGLVSTASQNGEDAIYGIGNAFDITGVRYLEGEGSKEYPRLNVTMEWVDMSKVRVDGRFRNQSMESDTETEVESETESGPGTESGTGAGIDAENIAEIEQLSLAELK